MAIMTLMKIRIHTNLLNKENSSCLKGTNTITRLCLILFPSFGYFVLILDPPLVQLTMTV